MFCSKCGANVPDGAAFCPQCGNRFDNQQAPVAGATMPQAAYAPAANAEAARSRGASGISTKQILTLVFAVITLVFAFMPWLLLSDNLLALGRVGSATTSILSGGAYSTSAFAESYGVLNLGAFVDALASYGVSNSNFSTTNLVVQVCWGVGIILMVVGAVMFFLKRKKALLITGCVILFLTALFFTAIYLGSFVDAGEAKPCFNSSICALGCIVTLILAALTKRQRA